MRCWVSSVALLLLAGFAAAEPDHACTCSYKDGTAKEGDVACIDTAKGKQLARCDMFLNNTTWVPLDKPCSSEESRFPPKPAPETAQKLVVAG